MHVASLRRFLRENWPYWAVPLLLALALLLGLWLVPAPDAAPPFRYGPSRVGASPSV